MATSFVKPPPGLESNEDRGKPIIGEWNHFELAIGKRGYGKSHLLMVRLEELDIEANGAYKLGHSLGQRFPVKDDKGNAVIDIALHYYEKLEQLDKGLRRSPDDFHVLVGDDNADALVQYAQALGQSVIRRAKGFWNRRGTAIGKPATPVICVIDEMVALEASRGSAQGNNDGRWFRKMVISLRHNHVALLAGIQDSNAMSYFNAGQATAIYCFHMTHQWAIQALTAGGLPKEQAERLTKLERGEYIRVEG